MSQLSGGGGGGGGVSELVNQETSQAPPTKGAASRSPSTAGGANKNPRMGYAIGYLRKAAVNQQVGPQEYSCLMCPCHKCDFVFNDRVTDLRLPGQPRIAHTSIRQSWTKSWEVPWIWDQVLWMR